MARNVVYGSFEVREGFGPAVVGSLRFESETREEAEREFEELSMDGFDAQLFGVGSRDGEGEGERVLLRMLLGRRAA